MAQAGFAEEERRGIDRAAPNRNYRDPNPKPETIFPLTEFHGLCGVRPAAEIAQNLSQACPNALHDDICELRKSTRIDVLYRKLVTTTGDKKEQILDELDQKLSKNDGLTESYWLNELCRIYPNDLSVLSPLILRCLTLQPGQSLHNPAGVLHAWLRGTTIEIMANSDNVLRAGLTPKHMDPTELFKVATLNPAIVPSVRAQEKQHEIPGYYRLTRMSTTTGDSIPYHDSPSIVLCLSGETQLFREEISHTLKEGLLI
jgi:mannose-6-phosphate isomerase